MLGTNSQNALKIKAGLVNLTTTQQQYGSPIQPNFLVQFTNYFSAGSLFASCNSSQYGKHLKPQQTFSHLYIHRSLGLWHKISQESNQENEYATIGTRNRHDLKILSRIMEMSSNVSEKIVQNAEKQDFDYNNLLFPHKVNIS